MNLRKCLELLLEKINTDKIIMKPADKGSIIVVMIPRDYYNMCYRHLSNAAFYDNLDNNVLSAIVQDKVIKMLKNNVLTKRCDKILNFCSLN